MCSTTTLRLGGCGSAPLFPDAAWITKDDAACFRRFDAEPRWSQAVHVAERCLFFDSVRCTGRDHPRSVGPVATRLDTNATWYVHDDDIETATMRVRRCAPPPPPPPPIRYTSEDAVLVGAHGDRTDFRGRDGALYALLSVPRLSLALRAADASYIKPGHAPRIVHGSFFTEAVWRVRTTGGVEWVVNASASALGFDVVDMGGARVASKPGAWRELIRDDLRVLYKQTGLVLRVAGWETNVTRRPVYNRLQGPAWRFEATVRALPPEFEVPHGAPSARVWPHGLLGQTWDGDGAAVDGARDAYDPRDVETRTTCAGEGGIEGRAEDYVLRDKYDHAFVYSRYDATDAGPRNAWVLSGTRRAAQPLPWIARVRGQTGIGYRR